ncbi:MAG: HD domain-containing protein [Butyrivibrio sp.]|nr:HD domain-containing protein [Butyrivibrio sp.]
MKAVTRLQLKEGMVIAEDVLNYKNELIVPINTTVNQGIIALLASNSIMVVKVKEEIDLGKTRFEKLKASDDFHIFETRYKQCFIKYKEIMMECVDKGAAVDIPALMNIYDLIMSNIRTGEELLDYLTILSSNEDELTHSHCLNSALIAGVFGLWLGYGNEDIQTLIQAGFVYDIGKLRLPYRILWKPDKLTEAEYSLVKHHTYLSEDMLKRTPLNDHVIKAVAQHHERIDGSGYPDGLTDKEIDPFAKCIAIIDSYEAMTSPRAYREPKNAFQVIDILENQKNKKYDGKMLEIILTKIASSQLGLVAKIKDGRLGIVTRINRNALSKPVLTLDDRTPLDLSKMPWLPIEHIM